MLIGEQTARTLWPNADPIGQHVKIGGDDRSLAHDRRHRRRRAASGARRAADDADVHAAGAADRFVPDDGDPVGRRSVGAGGRGAPGDLVGRRATCRSTRSRRWRTWSSESVGPRRFVMVLLELFGAVALLMTAIGVYGVISYSVAERTREIGIRAALGASPRDIVRLVVGGGLAVVCAGLAVGVLVALGGDAVPRELALRRQRDRPGDVRRRRRRPAGGGAGRAGRADRARDARRSVDRAAAGLARCARSCSAKPLGERRVARLKPSRYDIKAH